MQEPIDHRINSTAVTQSEFNAQQIRFLPTIIEFVRKRFVYDKLQYKEIEEVELKTTSYENSMNQSVNTIFIMGIPLRKNCVVPAKTLLIEQITKISNMVDCV